MPWLPLLSGVLMTWLDSGSNSPAYHPAGSYARPVEIEVDVSADAATVLISGELDLVSMPVLAARLPVVLRQRPRRLIFDMAGTTFMDCACARLLASRLGRARAQRRPRGLSPARPASVRPATSPVRPWQSIPLGLRR
jgi:anti-anti-sigma factor